MYDFIVLGLLPGTHIQLTFQQWQILVAAIFIGLTIRQLPMPNFAKILQSTTDRQTN